ncbi:MAG: VCBS repeat-containing protein, partial [Verrucomicrobiota bacterium]|nr:VCBS repeat-containing protein [Verrucomicrobiota bacterium]
GRFRDQTAAVGLAAGVRPYLGWATAFFDADNDGWLDLFVANGHIYPQVDVHPSGYRYAQRNLFYRNLGGRFAQAEAGPGFLLVRVSRGVALGDYDNDGDLDLYLANVGANALYRNDGDQVFQDVASEAGIRIHTAGWLTAMAAWADYDGDGWLDLYLANVGSNVLLNNGGDGLTLSPSANEAGVSIGALGEMLRVSWAATFFDYDNDGDEDLYVVSGHLKQPQFLNPVEQPNALFR